MPERQNGSMMNRLQLEVCVDSIGSAVSAERGGADRLELCSDLIVGGTTPCAVLYREIRRRVAIPIRVLIRPRFGDFCYSEEEFGLILGEIRLFRDLGADAVVIGCLRPDGTFDREQMKQAVDAAGPMEITCHRAFDVCRDPFEALDLLTDLGIGTVLTSGQKRSVSEGADLLAELVRRSAGKISVMPGGGVNAKVLRKLVPEVGAGVYHMSGKKIVESRMQYRSQEVSMGLPSLSEYEIWETDENAVRAARTVLDEFTEAGISPEKR